jgi:hypothetical protein
VSWPGLRVEVVGDIGLRTHSMPSFEHTDFWGLVSKVLSDTTNNRRKQAIVVLLATVFFVLVVTAIAGTLGAAGVHIDLFIARMSSAI